MLLVQLRLTALLSKRLDNVLENINITLWHEGSFREYRYFRLLLMRLFIRHVSAHACFSIF